MKKNDGGPAFPQISTELYDDDGHPLPGPRVDSFGGMSLRDYFASKAMQGFLSQSHAGPKDWTDRGHGWGEDCANDMNCHKNTVAITLSEFAYRIADAMIEARKQ